MSATIPSIHETRDVAGVGTLCTTKKRVRYLITYRPLTEVQIAFLASYGVVNDHQAYSFIFPKSMTPAQGDQLLDALYVLMQAR